MATSVASICYVRIGNSSLQASARFAAEIIGLQRVAERDGEIAFRSDGRFQTLTIHDGDAATSSVGVELWDEAELDKVEARLGQAGFAVQRAGDEDCRRRYVQAALLANDGSGNRIDLVVRPQQSGRRYFPSRDAGVTGFHGAALRSTDLARDLVLWRDVLGAQVSDRVGEITYLRTDDLHHRIALYPSGRRGLLYLAFEVETLDCIMQNSYFMQERQVKIVQGPGRQPASGQIFLHVQSPDDALFSYVNAMTNLGSAKRHPRQFARSPESLCAWGSESRDLPELAACDALGMKGDRR